MPSPIKIAKFFLILLLIVAAIIAMIILKKDLDAKVAEYRAIVQEMRDQPEEDRLALRKITDEIKEKIDSGYLYSETCPQYSTEVLVEKSPWIDKIAVYEDPFMAITKDGFTLQYNGHAYSDLPDHSMIRLIIHQQFASMVKSFQAGEKEQAINRLSNIAGFIYTYEHSPQYDILLMGLIFESLMHETIIYLLPMMSKEELTAIREMVATLPDVSKTLVPALKTKVYTDVELLDHLGRGDELPGYEPGTDSGIENFLELWSGPGDSHLLFMIERYWYISVATREIESIKQWLTSGANGEPQMANTIGIGSTSIIRIFLANTRILMEQFIGKMNERNTLFKAMDLELKRRAADPKHKVVIPYGHEKKIVLKADYGCIVQDKKAVEEIDSTPDPKLKTKTRPVKKAMKVNMAQIPGGWFHMGCSADDSDCEDNEKPRKRVYVDSFYMDVYEVTNAQYAAFLNRNGNRCDGHECLDEKFKRVLITRSSGSWNVSSGYGGHPATNLTWYGAKAYCESLGKRLPTDAV